LQALNETILVFTRNLVLRKKFSLILVEGCGIIVQINRTLDRMDGQMLPKRRSRLLINAALTVFLPLSAFFLTVAVRRSSGFAENIYLPFSRAVSGFLGWLFSFSAYAIAEVLLITLAAATLFFLIRSAVRSVRGRTAWPLLIWLSNALLCAAFGYFLFITLWGGNYYAPKLPARLGLQTGPQTEEILYRTAERHLEDVILYARTIPRDASGAADAGGFYTLAPEAVRSTRALTARYPGQLGGAIVSPPKRALFYPVFGMLGIAGVYTPFTGEATVAAHRLGIAAEDDANFIAYLACMASDKPIFRYSGSLMAFNYCYGAITDTGYLSVLYSILHSEAAETLEDFGRNRERWSEYEGPLREAAEAVNDAYLQSMGQEEGVRSYGRVTDLLIALYLFENSVFCD
jgi:hypothetical protein